MLLKRTAKLRELISLRWNLRPWDPYVMPGARQYITWMRE